MEIEKQFYTLPNTNIVLVVEVLQNVIRYSDINKTCSWATNKGQTVGCGIDYTADEKGRLFINEWDLLPNGTRQPVSSPRITGLTIRDLAPCQVSTSIIDMNKWGPQ